MARVAYGPGQNADLLPDPLPGEELLPEGMVAAIRNPRPGGLRDLGTEDYLIEECVGLLSLHRAERYLVYPETAKQGVPLYWSYPDIAEPSVRFEMQEVPTLGDAAGYEVVFHRDTGLPVAVEVGHYGRLQQTWRGHRIHTKAPPLHKPRIGLDGEWLDGDGDLIVFRGRRIPCPFSHRSRKWPEYLALGYRNDRPCNVLRFPNRGELVEHVEADSRHMAFVQHFLGGDLDAAIDAAVREGLEYDRARRASDPRLFGTKEAA